MSRGVRIEPEPANLPDHSAGLELLRAVHGRGTDAGGSVQIELDAVGDLVDVTISDLVVAEGARAVAVAVAEAFRAARAATTQELERHADEIAARTRRQRDDNLERLEQIAAQATAQFDAMAARLETIANGGGARG